MKLLLMRKQIFIATILFVCCIQSSAQLDQGRIYTGISSENRLRLFYKSYGVKPELSYALDKHSLIGISYNHFRTNSYDLFNSPNTKVYGIQNGVGISYNYFRYFKNSRKLGWYANANLDFNRIKYFDIKNTGETQLRSRVNQTELSLRPGLFYKPSQNFMVFANVGGISLLRENGTISGPLNFGSQVNVGVLINLDIFRKKK